MIEFHLATHLYIHDHHSAFLYSQHEGMEEYNQSYLRYITVSGNELPRPLGLESFLNKLVF